MRRDLFYFVNFELFFKWIGIVKRGSAHVGIVNVEEYENEDKVDNNFTNCLSYAHLPQTEFTRRFQKILVQEEGIGMSQFEWIRFLQFQLEK